MPRLRLAIILLAALAGCASAPPTLVALPPAPAGSSEPDPGATVLVREVALPGYLDSFPVVLGRNGGTLAVSRDAEWAERPSLGVSRVLVDALSQRLGASRVLIAGDGRIPDADLSVDFVALDPEGASLHLDARWFFSCAARKGSGGGRTRLRVPLAAATPQAVAAAMSDALGRLADTLAAEVPCGGTRS
jgi:uncharacterized lipoprotein YmbA